ncbi:MAG: hypothetical protein AUG51_09230 [Acidobacteria bacterium 13_1_20CM_3_53_8]|nr:MAG: hypothetical protein AUG51_09230 [Acidobacteria bacterium 13_1_20CM_3_53_8]
MSSSEPVPVQGKATSAEDLSDSAGIAWAIPTYKTDITVSLLKSGIDDDQINQGRSEIRGRLTTTVIGKRPQIILIETTVQDGQEFPNNGITLATFSKTTVYLPVVFSVLVEESDFGLNPNETILNREFDLETTNIDWANGQVFQITGAVGGYKVLLKFQVAKIV